MDGYEDSPATATIRNLTSQNQIPREIISSFTNTVCKVYIHVSTEFGDIMYLEEVLYYISSRNPSGQELKEIHVEETRCSISSFINWKSPANRVKGSYVIPELFGEVSRLQKESESVDFLLSVDIFMLFRLLLFTSEPVRDSWLELSLRPLQLDWRIRVEGGRGFWSGSIIASLQNKNTKK